ncbi:IS4 family transposase [Bacillus cereus]|uniref:IS4 family transposase n=1 Tax=Bacillus cereus TaxID=1396 RepID=UPI000BED3304|nr:IS4 family transposase [Bacillus cereus]PEC87376.1 IS4 family transposase [Bacillus cereus]PEX40068.1 IS4 family transposase [Bacillus cereus]PFB16559.1 IS4 family transposase [Bacillus cereus]PFP60633.1 IS4 family transposase [Bacillus cereus]PFV60191.1 IS4 family transposase [Bacillus cereus]
MTLSIQDEFHLFAEELQRYLSPSILQQLAQETGFVKRKSKYGARDLAALCIWISQHVASDSLTRLCSQLYTNTATLMSPEGLNQRFNPAAVAFLREVFTSLLTQKLCSNHSLSAHIISTFNRIRILDATVFQLPDQFATDYQGSGGSSNKAGVKIQLEYDLLSGQFLNVQLGYGTICLETVEAGDLCLRDLGYFDLGDLQTIHDKEAYYISRLKLNTRIYTKNPEPKYFNNGTVKKQTEYIQLDMTQMMSDLIPGETIEIPEAYIGQNQKLPARVIIHRLTDDQTKTRLKNQAIREKKKGIVMKDKSKRLMGMNVYITNTSLEDVPTNYVHSLYSLRWQIEILFKTWKSFFEIDKCQNIKRERLECHLYGQLIGILLCSSTMFQIRQLLLEKKKQELSEYKAIYMIKDYFPLLFQAIAVGTEELLKILHRLYQLLKKNGRKCHRYKKMTVFDILGIVYKTAVKHRQAA